MKRSKRYVSIREQVDKTKRYSIDEALETLKKLSSVKFDETVEISMRMGVDPKRGDQNIRGAVTLPNGTGKSVKVLVFAEGDKAKEATEAGADFIGDDETIEKIKKGFMDFQVVIATPDMMKNVGKIGKILGPRGLMPNPKTGTVTPDVGKAVRESKMGKVNFRLDKSGNIHSLMGKLSFEKEKLAQNIESFIKEIKRAKPQTAKGVYIKNVTLSSTMGPGVPIDLSEVAKIK